jgi:hypothetical protein
MPTTLDRPAEWRVFLERQVSACLVVVGGMQSEDASKMPGTDDRPYRADQTFHIAFCHCEPGDIGRSRMPTAPHPAREDMPVYSVIIAQRDLSG